MQLGVRAHDMGKGSIKNLAEAVAQHGFSCVQLSVFEVLRFLDSDMLNPRLAFEFCNEFDKQKIQISILSCYINPIHPDGNERKRQIKEFKQHLAFARDLGCSIVATETGSKNVDLTFHPENHQQKARNELLESLDEMLEAAQHYGRKIGIEGVEKFVAHDVESINEILNELSSEHLGVVFDAFNLLTPATIDKQTQIMKAAFERFGDKIFAIHLKDYITIDNRIKGVPIGLGQMDFKTLISYSKQRKAGLPFILEEQSSETVDQSIYSLKKIYNLC